MSRSDGCSVPAVLKKMIPPLQDFCDKCDATDCAEHDEGYRIGGSEADRIVLDFKLFQGARRKCSDETAAAVFDAVRTYGRLHWATDRPWHGGDADWPEEPQAP